VDYNTTFYSFIVKLVKRHIMRKGPLFTQNQRANQGIYIGPTVGKSSPKNSRQACLCLDKDTYDVKCCKGYLQNQGIGQTQSAPVVRGDFSARGFGDGFEVGDGIVI
jgi:hypothetical protein